MKIAFVSSEVLPFSKTGGLADVVYSLGKELAKAKNKVIIVSPFYSSIKCEDAKHVYDLNVKMSWRNQKAVVYNVERENMVYYLIKNDQYFSRGHLYGDFDDGERFAFFTLASKLVLRKQRVAPDIIHIHDWQAGMLPCIIKEEKDPYFNNTRFVGTIHNPAFQGLFPKIVLGDLYNLPDSLFDNGQVRFKGQVSTLKTMIVYCEKITTVSPTHHEELLTKEGSMDLDSVLRLREYDFSGILNGIDYLEFDPKNDKNIAANFSISNVFKGKQENKLALLNQFKLQGEDLPLYSLVTRITWQKGFDLVFPAVEELIKRGANIIMLGSGEYDYEQRWEELRNRYPEHIGLFVGYSDALAHKIYAGSDFFLMPSLFEPCGLGQMIAQRYGTLPIVRRTGGLKDSVINYDGSNIDSSNGYGFDAYSVSEMINTVNYAYDNYLDKKTHRKLVKNAVNTDNTWLKSMNEYMQVYKQLIPNK